MKEMIKNSQIIVMGIFLVLMGSIFTMLMGNTGSIIGFIIAMAVVGYMINMIRENKSTTIERCKIPLNNIEWEINLIKSWITSN